MLLAEVAQDHAGMGAWLTQLGAVAAIALTLLKVWDFTRAKPPLHEVYATKDELRELRERHSRETEHLHRRISGLREDLTKSGDERAEKILGAVDGVNQRLARFERDIGRIESGLEHLKTK